MTAVNAIKELLTKFDLFSVSQFLRFKKDADAKTFTGGIISFAIILFLIITFANMILETFNKVIITSSSYQSHPQTPSSIHFSTESN